MIIVAHGYRENVYDNITKVEQNPASIRCAFGASAAPKFLADPLINCVKNSLELPITLAGADHKVVGNRVQIVQVQHHDIASQFVLGELDGSPREGGRFDGGFFYQNRSPITTCDDT